MKLATIEITVFIITSKIISNSVDLLIFLPFYLTPHSSSLSLALSFFNPLFVQQ